MALADDIRELAQRSLRALDESRSYYARSKGVWRLLQQVVDRGGKLSFMNPVTATREDHGVFLGFANQYVAVNLAQATFQEYVSLFEAFFFDLLRLWLTAYPRSLSKRTLEFSTVLDAPDKTAITLAIVDRELNELKYERPADWFEYLEKIARLGVPTADEVERIAEIKASRDILIHNQGVVNAIYLAKAGARARYRDGEPLEIPTDYHQQSWETIKKVIRDVSDAALAKT